MSAFAKKRLKCRFNEHRRLDIILSKIVFEQISKQREERSQNIAFNLDIFFHFVGIE